MRFPRRFVRRPTVRAWIEWVVHLATALAAGILLIPFLRCWPREIHKFGLGLADWQRWAFLFVLCVLVVNGLFRVFSPRLAHLRYVTRRPPVWSAWLLAAVFVALADLFLGLSIRKPRSALYQATWVEWLGYGVGSLVAVWAWRWLQETMSPPNGSGPETRKAENWFRRSWNWLSDKFSGLFKRADRNQTGDPPGEKDTAKQAAPHQQPSTIRDLLEADWDTFVEWLKTDTPATPGQDLLDNYEVAQRLVGLLQTGTRSIGIVGAFGSGKTTIVDWMRGLLAQDATQRDRLPISYHSCWGFETSDLSIHAMLNDALETLGRHLDTFPVRGLPEAYRRRFSESGGWLGALAGLFLERRSPVHQFRRLSELLQTLGMRLVLVVEDLDRNNSRSFDVQEVVAFLEQLKQFDNLSFILTGGLRAPAEIDFARLCDHIEYMRTVPIEQAALLVAKLRTGCLKRPEFQHEVLTPDRSWWNPDIVRLGLTKDRIWPVEAIGRLAQTPRALRQVLWRTYRAWAGNRAWRGLYGEIDWDHLLVINVLRFAASEAFNYVVNHWHRVNKEPSERNGNDPERKRAKELLLAEWKAACSGGEWDDRAARVLIDLILPAFPVWLGESDSMGDLAVQGVHQERYWQRALRETIPPTEVPDQEVIAHIKQWKNSPSRQTNLVKRLREDQAYGEAWERLAPRFFEDDIDFFLQLCGDVLAAICEEEGLEAGAKSQGFVEIFRCASKCVRKKEEVRKVAPWLTKQIRLAAPVSLKLVRDLWLFWATPDGEYSFLRDTGRDVVRPTVIGVLKKVFENPEWLDRLMRAGNERWLQEMVCSHEQPIAKWCELGPSLLEGLRKESPAVAVEVAALLAAGDRDTGSVSVNPEVLRCFFPDNAREVAERLAELADRIEEAENQRLVKQMAESVKRWLDESESGG